MQKARAQGWKQVLKYNNLDAFFDHDYVFDI